MENATAQNVKDSVKRLKNASPLLTDALAKGTLKIVGGVYRLATGKVETDCLTQKNSSPGNTASLPSPRCKEPSAMAGLWLFSVCHHLVGEGFGPLNQQVLPVFMS